MVALLFSGAVGLGLYALGHRDAQKAPLRVLVAVDFDGYSWEGARPATTVAERLEDGFERAGFEALHGPGIVHDKVTPPSPAALAAQHRAGFILSAKVEPAIKVHRGEDGYVEAHVDTELEVRREGEAEGEHFRVTAWAGGPDRALALDKLAEVFADKALRGALPLLCAHPEVTRMREGARLPADHRHHEAARAVAEEARALSAARRRYELLMAEGLGPAAGSVTLHGALPARESLAAVGASGMLVASHERELVMQAGQPAWIGVQHHVLWRPHGGEPRPIWSGARLLGLPAVVPPAGKGEGEVVLVEAIDDWGTALTVAGERRGPRRLRVAPRRKLHDPALAPAGDAVAVWESADRDGPERLLVLSLDDGHPLFERAFDHAGGALAWIDDARLGFVAPADEAPGSEPGRNGLWILERGEGAPVARLIQPAPEGGEFHGLTVSPDGRTLASILGPRVAPHLARAPVTSGSRLALHDLGDASLALHDLGGEVAVASRPVFSPDGQRIAFIHGGDLALFERGTGEARRLLETPFHERDPAFSPDGRRLVFTVAIPDPVLAGGDAHGGEKMELVASIALP